MDTGQPISIWYISGKQIGDMPSDLAAGLKAETSELELIEKDLASTHYINNQQNIHPSFHSASKHSGFPFNETILPKSASPVSFNITDSGGGDNVKKNSHNQVLSFILIIFFFWNIIL
ncbi:unnamed protein product [Onchocerca flexuosa]|uniref:GYF_2 domain-containing protein n=1 Tax=Onchocerca flexuosa TaxID=387005 RepID=A0A183I5M8_9BILA|nr:unnamed protein product [Onchocerca flexuosa]